MRGTSRTLRMHGPLMVRFSAAGDTELSTHSCGRRLKITIAYHLRYVGTIHTMTAPLTFNTFQQYQACRPFHDD